MGEITPHIQEFRDAGITSADFNQNKCSFECESDITQLDQSDSETVKIGKMVKTYITSEHGVDKSCLFGE